MNIQASESLDRSGEDKAGEQEGQRETTCNQTNKQKRKKKIGVFPLLFFSIRAMVSFFHSFFFVWVGLD